MGAAPPSGERVAAGARPDAGGDGACRGAAISLLAAAVDPRCAVSPRDWEALLRAAGTSDAGALQTGAREDAKGIRQRARREGDRVVVSLVNEGAGPVVLPVRFHPGHPELAFSVLAALDEQTVFELAPPVLDVPREPPRIGGVRPSDTHRGGPPVVLDDGPPVAHVHSARIELPPGGVAHARLAVDPRIVRRLDRSCDAGAGTGQDAGLDARLGGCLPARLPKGHVVLYVGQLVAPTVESPPARVEWDLP